MNSRGALDDFSKNKVIKHKKWFKIRHSLIKWNFYLKVAF
jgi:hypothetical protein